MIEILIENIWLTILKDHYSKVWEIEFMPQWEEVIKYKLITKIPPWSIFAQRFWLGTLLKSGAWVYIFICLGIFIAFSSNEPDPSEKTNNLIIKSQVKVNLIKFGRPILTALNREDPPATRRTNKCEERFMYFHNQNRCLVLLSVGYVNEKMIPFLRQDKMHLSNFSCMSKLTIIQNKFFLINGNWQIPK